MATGQTPTYLLPYPLSTDQVDVHGDIFELADRLEDVIGGILPSQSGNTGKVLTTNGSALSWASAGITLTNPVINNINLGYTTTATAAGTTTLTVDSNSQQFFTGSTTQTIVLPVASTMTLGQGFYVENLSSGNLTVNSSGGNLVVTVIPGITVLITCILTSGTAAASWDVDYHGFATITGSGSNVLGTSPSLTNPIIGTVANNSAISAASSAQSSQLWAAVTTGSIAIGAGLTTGSTSLANSNLFNGTVNIASGAGTINKSINIGTASTAGTTTVNIGSTAGATNVVNILGSVLTTPRIKSAMEIMTVTASAIPASANFDALTQSVQYYSTAATANWTLNVRGSAAITLNTMLAINDSLTVVVLNTNTATAYYPTSLTIDGTPTTVNWQGGTAPSAGNANSIDVYTYTIIKTAANTYTVLGSQTKFA
jgi:hypothetical protein